MARSLFREARNDRIETLMAERRIINGYIYERGADGSIVPVGPAGGGQGGSQMPVDPTYELKGPKARTDLQGSLLDNQGQALANQLAQMKIDEENRKKAEEASAKAEAESAKGTAITELVSTIKAAREAKQLSRDGWFATGFGASTARDWGGTSAADVKGKLDTIGGNVAFDRLQRMRDASKTGGALGSVSEKELDLLRGTIASLDQTQSDAQFQSSMDRIIQVYGDTLKKLSPEQARELGIGERDRDPAAAFLNGEGSAPVGPGGLPIAAGARDRGTADSSGVVASSRGGFTQVPGLAGIDQAVIDMVGQGASAQDVVRFLDTAYRQTEPEHGGSLRVDPSLASWVGDLVEEHRANPNKPVRSLRPGWELLSGYETPSQEQSFLDTLSSPGDWLGLAADTNAGNLAMNAANAATAGLPAYLAGDKGSAVMSAARLERPKTTLAGDVGGSIAGLVGANRLLGSVGQLGSRAANLGGGIITDTAYGATRGGLENGTEGALLGAIGGLGGNAAGRYALAPAVTAAAGTRAGQAATSAVGRGGNALANAGRGLFGRNPRQFTPTPVPAAIPAGSRAVANRLPDDAAAQLREAQSLGLPLAVADLSPELQALTGSVVRKSPDARTLAEQTLRPRFQGQADRARDQITRNFGAIDNPNEVSDRLLETARRNAGPLYDDFRAQPARTSDELQAMLQTPAGQQALTNARSIAANEGRDPNAMGFDLDDLGQVVLRSDPSPETLDLVKRGLDDVVSGNQNPLTGRIETDAGRAVEGLRRRFVGEVDRLYPQYAPARAAYAGPAAERAALQTGRDMARAAPRDIQARMGSMSQPQQEQFRLGQRVAMGDAVDRARLTSNPYQSVWGSGDARNRAATVFGDEPASRFQRAYDIEDNMGRTYTEALGGSQTAPRLAADEAFDSMVGNVAEAGGAIVAGGGGLGELARNLAGGVRDRWRVGASRARADEMAPLLLNTRPGDMAQAIEELAALSAARNLYVQGARKRGGLFGASVGTTALPALGQ